MATNGFITKGNGEVEISDIPTVWSFPTFNQALQRALHIEPLGNGGSPASLYKAVVVVLLSVILLSVEGLGRVRGNPGVEGLNFREPTFNNFKGSCC